MKDKREFNPHDRVWYMDNNRPVQGRVYIKQLRANTYVVDGEIKSVDTSYTIVENYSRTQDGQNRGIEQLFETKEALLDSL